MWFEDEQASPWLEGLDGASFEGSFSTRRSIFTKASDSTIEGNVKTKNRVLAQAKNSSIEGKVEAEEHVIWKAENSVIKGNVKTSGGLIGSSKNSTVEGDVEADGAVNWSSENSTVEGNVKAGKMVLWNSRNSVVRGDVEAGTNVMHESEDSVVRGDVEAENSVLNSAEDSSVHGNVEAGTNVMWASEDSVVRGDVEAGKHVLHSAQRSTIEGDVSAGEGLLDWSDDSVVIGDVEAKGEVLEGAQNCFVISEKLSAPSIGSEAFGGLVAAEELNVDDVYENTTVITQDDRSGALSYQGDWEEISGFVAEEVRKDNFGSLRGLELFDLDTDKDIEGIDGFKKELKRINNVYDQYKDSLEAYKHWRQEVKLKNLGCKSNEDRLDYLDQLRGFLLEEVSDELDVDEDAAEAIFQPEDPSVFSEIKDFTPQSGDLEEFIHAHRGGIGESYEKKYDLDSQKTITDEMVSEINSKFLEEASELLEDVLDGSAGYDIDETIDGYQEKVVPMVEKKKELGEEIENHFEKGERGKAENKIEQKKRLEQDIRAQKKELASDFVHENMDGTQRDSSENYKRVLKQLSQRYLGGKARKKAEELSKDIVVNEEDLESGSILKLNRWRKDISDIPSYRETQCCAMPGSGNAGIINYSVFEYMENDSVDILEFETGGKYGIAITAYGENDRGEDVMVVDSVETPSHVIDREDVSNTLAKAIEDYAKNQGCEEVIYNSTVGNSAPKEFYDNISGERYEETSDMEVEIEDEKEIRIESSTDSLKGKKAAI